MDWKEFLEPEWKKLALFIIIVLAERIINTFILGYYLVYSVKLPSMLMVSPFDIFNSFMIPILVTTDKTAIVQLGFDTLIGGLTHLLNLLWQYFLACLLIFVCRNFSKKSKAIKTKEKEK